MFEERLDGEVVRSDLRDGGEASQGVGGEEESGEE